MEHKLLVLCDSEEDYAQHMTDYLRRKMGASWDILTYTKPAELEKLREAKTEIEILLLAEAVFGEFSKQLPAKLVILLNESGVVKDNNLPNIDKYQTAERVRQEILAHYMEGEGEYFPEVRDMQKGKLIGMYSPIRRCLQTTFALTYGQLLAQRHKVLFLSFEHYGGIEEWREDSHQDLAALLYLQQTKPQEFMFHMQTLVQRVGELHFIAPMFNGENLLYVTSREWQELLAGIVQSGEYEYIILDLSESIQGLFEILGMCEQIYTIVLEEAKALCKLRQYEQLLALQECEDVQKKTIKCKLPIFRRLPTDMEQYTKGELADYVRDMMERRGN